MPEVSTGTLRVVDGLRLPPAQREALLPGAQLRDRRGASRQLPRYFYEVPSWNAALEMELSPHFHLWEFLHTDVRETETLRVFPRYVPCAVSLTALVLERLRDAVEEPVRIAANGGYRSPRHALTTHASTHCWGTAVNIYRIGNEYLDSRESIERYADVARETLPAAWVRPFGEDRGLADDHLHLDFGYVVAIPHDVPGDAERTTVEGDPL